MFMTKKLIAAMCIISILIIAVIFITASGLYRVTFNLNYETDAEAIVMSKFKIKKDGIPVPVRDEYEFIGWYLDNITFENEFDVNSAPGDTEVYAHWKKIICDVVFDLNGGVAVSGETSVTVNGGETVTPPEIKYENTQKVFTGWYTDAKYLKKWDSESGIHDNMTIYAKWDNYYESELLVLPKIYIDLGGAKSVSKNTYVPITVSVTGSGFDFTNISANIRGRGNSTWSEFNKKPYRLKFDKKIDLFGMGARKDWILLANAMDHSLMRNYLMFVMANEFGEVYTSGSQWVHLFINDEYQGVYLLCEQTESGEYRVDIETEHGASDVDVGFLIEYGGSADIGDNKYFRFNAVSSRKILYQMSNHNAVIKYPKADTCTDRQRDYIADYANKVNDAILKCQWETILELVDIDTFVDNFIVEEVMLNNDMGWNFFFYKPAGGKLCLGPHWDFDQSAGASTYGGETYEGWGAGSPHPWFEALVTIDEFMVLVKERWLEKYDFLHSIPNTFIDEKAEEYKYDIEANFTKWNVLGVRHWRSVASLDKEKTYEGHKNYLKTWLKNRLNWIEGQLGIE